MATITIKGMPAALYRRLRTQAAAHRRSLNSEILVCLEQTADRVPPDSVRLLKMADDVRSSIKLPFLTDKFLRAAIHRGRA